MHVGVLVLIIYISLANIQDAQQYRGWFNNILINLLYKARSALRTFWV